MSIMKGDGMIHDYMGYGDIYGGLFDNRIFGESGLSFRFFSDSDAVFENLNIPSLGNTVKKIVHKEVNNQNCAVCINC